MKARLLELCHRHQLGHLTSSLTTLPILSEIFDALGDDDIFILSSGHAGPALYVAMEMYGGYDADKLFQEHGLHPHLNSAEGIYCSTGSLGQGITVAVGYALADRRRKVHCLISDGECAEGCVWEALAFAKLHHLDNLIVHVNANGQSALGVVDVDELEGRLHAFLPAVNVHRMRVPLPNFLHGIHGHYHAMTDDEYAATK